MLVRTASIILNRFPYKETDLIATAYTQSLGKTSLLLYGARKQRSRLSQSLFHPLSMLDIVLDYKDSRELQSVKEASVRRPVQSLTENMDKVAIALFLAEVLNKVIQEREANEILYDFVEHAIVCFDTLSSHTNSFHLVFLALLTQYTGIQPVNNFCTQSPYFNLHSSCFEPQFHANSFSLDEQTSQHLSLLFEQSDGTCSIPFTNKEKSAVLQALIRYYTIHLCNLDSLKSLKVLKEIYG